MHKGWSKWDWEKGKWEDAGRRMKGKERWHFSNFRFRPKREIINLILSCKRLKKTKLMKILKRGILLCCLCLAEHMKTVSLRQLLSELLFRKSPTINLGRYHTVLYGTNVPKVERLAKTQKMCFFCTNRVLMQGPVPWTFKCYKVNFSPSLFWKAAYEIFYKRIKTKTRYFYTYSVIGHLLCQWM